MQETDWIVTGALVLLVVRQLRGRPVTVLGLLWPVGLVAWAGVAYLRTVPPGGPDLVLVAVLALVGIALGSACGALTRVHRSGTRVVAVATPTAAALWILGMGSRLAFGLVALDGGAEAIGRASAALGLVSGGTWATALIVMALGEVVARTAVLATRRHRLLREVVPADA